MKRLLALACLVFLNGCALLQNEESPTTGAQVGIVNHTGRYIYSATINGAGGGNMAAWGAGHANICCSSIPSLWYPGIKVLVRWNMPEGIQDVIKEKVVEVERYDEPGSIYMHFFPNDEVRVVVSNTAGFGAKHPIAPPVKPAPLQR